MSSPDTADEDKTSVSESELPMKKPKLEPGDPEDLCLPGGDSVDIKSEPSEEDIIKEEIEIKEEIVGPQPVHSLASIGIQTDKDDIKDKVNRLIKHVQPQKQVVKGPSVDVKESHILQFRISLLRGKSAPSIWRRFQVPGSYNFRQFHVAIQKAMGWMSVEFDYHLHAFRVVNPRTRVKDSIVISEDVSLYEGSKDENCTKIMDYFNVMNHRGRYEYDFGIGWEHEFVVEKVFEPVPGEVYPRCIDGARACPPEDGVVHSDEEYDSDEFDPIKCF